MVKLYSTLMKIKKRNYMVYWYTGIPVYWYTVINKKARYWAENISPETGLAASGDLFVKGFNFSNFPHTQGNPSTHVWIFLLASLISNF